MTKWWRTAHLGRVVTEPPDAPARHPDGAHRDKFPKKSARASNELRNLATDEVGGEREENSTPRGHPQIDRRSLALTKYMKLLTLLS